MASLYRVYKAKDNTPVEDCFVLRPEKDPAARIALEAYAKATDNKALSEDILAALGDSGRVMVLPCKVGDTVYEVFLGDIDARRVGQFRLVGYARPDLKVDLDLNGRIRTVNWSEEAGKTIFRTCEEAEAKLKEVQGDD